METIKRALKLVRKYHVWSDQTGMGEVMWLTPRRARNLASYGWYTVEEVK